MATFGNTIIDYEELEKANLCHQVELGELCFLSDSREKEEPPTWWSTVEGSNADLRVTLEQWAVETISRSVQEIRGYLRAVHPTEQSLMMTAAPPSARPSAG